MFRSSLKVSLEVFQVVLVHLVYNPALFLAYCFFILVTCRRQCHLYLLIFSSTGSNFNSSRISSFLLWSKRVYPAILLKNFISTVVNRFLFLFSVGPNFASIQKKMGRASALYTSIPENFQTTGGCKCCLELPVFEQILLVFVAYLSHFNREFHNRDI